MGEEEGTSTLGDVKGFFEVPEIIPLKSNLMEKAFLWRTAHYQSSGGVVVRLYVIITHIF